MDKKIEKKNVSTGIVLSKVKLGNDLEEVSSDRAGTEHNDAMSARLPRPSGKVP